MSANQIDFESDVLVIGAGLSGLSAARYLHQAGISVRVVEARDRVGGRTLSENVGKGRFDMGGQWLGPTQDRMYELCEELGVELFPTFCDGTKVLELEGKISTYDGVIPSLGLLNLLRLQSMINKVEGLAAQADQGSPLKLKNARALDAMTLESWKQKNIGSKPIQGLLDAAVRVVFGAEASQISVLHFLTYLSGGGSLTRLIEIKNGAQQDRMVLGAQEVSLRMAQGLGERIHLAHPVQSIRRTDGGIEVEAMGADGEILRLAGKYGILALPPHLWGDIKHIPSLPTHKEFITQSTTMGATVKVLACYESAFWRDEGFSGEVVSTDDPFCVVFDNSSHDGKQPALLGFICGDRARTWQTLSAEQRKRECLQAFSRYFGEQARFASTYHEQDWATEPYSRGCPTANWTPGSMMALSDHLRTPVDSLHFAGTETARQWSGYMEGAVEAGRRAADEIIQRM